MLSALAALSLLLGASLLGVVGGDLLGESGARTPLPEERLLLMVIPREEYFPLCHFGTAAFAEEGRLAVVPGNSKLLVTAFLEEWADSGRPVRGEVPARGKRLEFLSIRGDADGVGFAGGGVGACR